MTKMERAAADATEAAYWNATTEALIAYKHTLASIPAVCVAREAYDKALAVARATYLSATKTKAS